MDVIDNVDATGEFDPVEAFTKAWTTEDAQPEKDKELSKAAEDTNEDDKPTDKHANEDADPSDDKVQDGENEDEGEADGEDEADPEDKAYVDSDDVFVKVKVDGEEREFAIKDLKRLAGQEASLTRKSQEVADTRKAVDAENQANAARLQGLLGRALERWKPYENVNLLVAAKQLEPEQLQALQSDMQARWDDIQFLTQEHDALTQNMRKSSHDNLVKAAQECIKTLSDPDKGIEGWSQELYTDICGYAKSQGTSAALINDLTDPAAFKIIHKAMLYDKGAQKVQQVKDKSKQKKAPPKKIVKSSMNAGAQKDVLKPSKAEDAIKKLRNTGSRDDAADAFVAMWADSSDT